MKQITSKPNIASKFYPANPSLNKNAEGFVCSININPQTISKSRNESRIDFLRRFPRKFNQQQSQQIQQNISITSGTTGKNTNWLSLINQYLEGNVTQPTQNREQPKQQQSLFATLVQQNLAKSNPTNILPQQTLQTTRPTPSIFQFQQQANQQQQFQFQPNNQSPFVNIAFQPSQPFQNSSQQGFQFQTTQQQNFQQSIPNNYQNQFSPFLFSQQQFTNNNHLTQPNLTFPTNQQQANFQLSTFQQQPQSEYYFNEAIQSIQINSTKEDEMSDYEANYLKQIEENITANYHYYNHHTADFFQPKYNEIIAKDQTIPLKKTNPPKIVKKSTIKEFNLKQAQYTFYAWIPFQKSIKQHSFTLNQFGLNLNSKIRDLKKALLINDYDSYKVAEYQNFKCHWKEDDDLIKSLNFGTPTIFLISSEYRNLNAPTIKGDMKCDPPIETLEQMSDEELSQINNFEVETAFGKVSFLEPIDLRNMVLDEIICFMQDSIEIKDSISAKCLITLYNFGCYSKQMNKLKKENFSYYCQRVKHWADDMNIQLQDITIEGHVTFELK